MADGNSSDVAKFQYAIKAHPTAYRNVLFRSRLEARWAAFFDLVSWEWHYEPFDLPGWSPDFLVYFECGHSECNKRDGASGHTLLVEVKPFFSIAEFEGHPCLKYPFGFDYSSGHASDRKAIPADASAAFGINPHVTYWEMAHGSGGGEECVTNWVREDVDNLWDQAQVKVRYEP